MNPKSVSSFVAGFLTAGAMFWLVGCKNATSPDPVAVQFRAGVGSLTPPSMAVQGGAGVVRITGGYEGASCGVPGGKAQRDGGVLRLDVGPAVTGPVCDLARAVYDYDASLIGIEPGRYTVEVYHRAVPNVRELAYSAVVTVD